MLRFESQTIEIPNRGDMKVFGLHRPADTRRLNGMGSAIEMGVGDQRRTLLTSLVQRIAIFVFDAERRQQLGQGATEFAYACQRNVSLSGVAFGGIGKYGTRARTEMRAVGGQPAELHVPVGGVVAISALGPDDPKRLLLGEGGHVMVRASMDDGGETLYASKFGANHPPVLHTFDALRDVFDIHSIGKVPVLAVLPRT